MKLKITGERKASINEGMIGLFFEDINYGLDGGLHAEMIENRSFEFYEAGGTKCNWFHEYDGLYGWSLETDVSGWEPAVGKTPADGNEKVWKSSYENGGATLRIRTEHPLSNVNPHYLEFTADESVCGFKNKAYEGVCMRAGTKYRVSLYAMAEAYDGEVSLSIEGEEIIVTTRITDSVTREWKKYETEICLREDIFYGDFVIHISRPGTVCFDFISMIPEDAVCGVFRKDLADLLRDMKPGFLRFPGGCVVEGNTIDNMYRWKESVGAPEERRANWNRWAVHGNDRLEGRKTGRYSHYNQTLGIGYYEYFLLCEYIGARALPVANVGMACQYESKELFEIEDPVFNDFIQDTLDLIEFANGSHETKWGGLRARMGHEAPFNMELLGIGNEQWETKESRFFERYRLFEKAIHERYPDIRLIGSAGPDVTSVHYTDAWRFYHEEAKDKPDFAYAVDEHYYVKPEWLFENTDFYDKYPRDVKVFAGEYAAHLDNGMNRPDLNCWHAALAEAAFLTGIERNADVVVMASYAPLFARLNFTQWSPDMIWFDGKSAYGTPGYYVQKLYSTCTGQYCIGIEADRDCGSVKYSASYDVENECIWLKLVNHSEQDITMELELYKTPDSETKCGREAYAYVMSGNLSDCNTVTQPRNVSPVRREVKCEKRFSYELKAHSFHVMSIPISKRDA